jgi:hypothetical protein
MVVSAPYARDVLILHSTNTKYNMTYIILTYNVILRFPLTLPPLQLPERADLPYI